jgi:hypothetical protein
MEAPGDYVLFHLRRRASARVVKQAVPWAYTMFSSRERGVLRPVLPRFTIWSLAQRDIGPRCLSEGVPTYSFLSSILV